MAALLLWCVVSGKRPCLGVPLSSACSNQEIILSLVLRGAKLSSVN